MSTHRKILDVLEDQELNNEISLDFMLVEEAQYLQETLINLFVELKKMLTNKDKKTLIDMTNKARESIDNLLLYLGANTDKTKNAPWFKKELPEDDYESFYPENVKPENIAQIIDWFLQRVEHIVDPSDMESIYITNDFKILRIEEYIKDWEGRYDHTVVKDVPVEIIFSDCDIYEWIREDDLKRKAAEKKAREKKDKADQVRHKAERKRDYNQLKKEFN